VDLEPGVWTFVHGAAQPCLIVNDIEFGDSAGAVALFVGPGTEGYFADLKITQWRAWSCFVCKRAHGVLAIRGQIGSNPL
jgi:hypothetical protein